MAKEFRRDRDEMPPPRQVPAGASVMSKLSAHDMADKLLARRIERPGPAAETLTNPVADTTMVVTLDELRPYELDPRITRNPLYEDIKASIRERGLEAPPPITRRPGADHYIIRNGGNTRLSILRELWTETKDEQFFRISCRFRPWSERGEIISLTGHLAENELHGGLTFIERALAVEKLRELYELEGGKPLSQSELARRLASDGYPVNQPRISRMQEAIHYLLPAIPNVLYAGLGRPQIEQLTALRRAAARSWEARSEGSAVDGEFETWFQSVLAPFDLGPNSFDVERVRDEFIGQMADRLGERFDTIAFEFTVPEKRALPPVLPEPDPPPAVQPRSPASGPASGRPVLRPQNSEEDHDGVDDDAVEVNGHDDEAWDGDEDESAALGDQQTVSPYPSSNRLQSIQRLVADHLGEEPADFAGGGVKAVPVQAGGLFPVSDIWIIEPGLDIAERLRIHIAQLAREIADEAGLADAIVESEHGIGFECALADTGSDALAKAAPARGILALLHALSAPYNPRHPAARIETIHLVRDFGPLLLGWDQPETSPAFAAMRLSDSGVVKLFRLIRLGRRVIELELSSVDGADAAPGS